MSSSEIAFLALGLVLGGALGAAFLAAVRSLPAPRREVRLTITQNSIETRRPATLSDPNPARDRPSPPGSPDEAAWPDRPAGTAAIPVTVTPGTRAAASPMRTRVSFPPTHVPTTAVAVPVVGGSPVGDSGGRTPAARRGPDAGAAPSSLMGSAVAVAIAVAEPPEPAPFARPTPSPLQSPTSFMDVGRPGGVPMIRPRRPGADAWPILAGTAVAVPVAVPVAGADTPRAVGAGGSGSRARVESAAADPCAPARASVGEQCAAADVAREGARLATDAMRRAQREFDTLSEGVDRARAGSDPRAIAATKAALHAEFREANAKATTADDAEAAARRWLSGIDRANADARAATRLVEAGARQLADHLPALERLVAAGDAARITAETAEQACRTAREALAECEEASAAATRPPVAGTPEPDPDGWPAMADPGRDGGTTRIPTESLSTQPFIFRMLNGDREARDRVVASLAGGDQAAVAAWQLRVSALLDAVTARAIEAGYLDLPDDDPFWALFTVRERREVVEALASLGFRFDALGGFADGRVPSARDLSLAVGYAGLDPMRIRIWPREAEIGALYARAHVASDEWLKAEADDLALGSLSDALAHRAADLGELWGAWGRIRPLLLATD